MALWDCLIYLLKYGINKANTNIPSIAVIILESSGAHLQCSKVSWAGLILSVFAHLWHMQKGKNKVEKLLEHIQRKTQDVGPGVVQSGINYIKWYLISPRIKIRFLLTNWKCEVLHTERDMTEISRYCHEYTGELFVAWQLL